MTDYQTQDYLNGVKNLLQKAALIYQYSHASATSLLHAFDDAKEKRGNPRGALTDQEQDILRAALVMSCAGMDGALKQAIRDCLQHLLDMYPSVREGFEKFIRKRISWDGDDAEARGGAKFLADVLADSDPRKRLVEAYIRELTGDSLQSVDEVLRTVAALGMDKKELKLDVPRLKEIFQHRNKIVHELDIDLDALKRKRVAVPQAKFVDRIDYVLDVTRMILQQLNERI